MMRLMSGALVLIALVGAGCNFGPEASPTPSLVIPTPPTATSAPPQATTAATDAPVPTITAPPSPTLPPISPTDTPAIVEPSPTLPPEDTPTPAPVSYRVVFVAPDDSLNVREDAGVDADIVMTLAPNAAGIMPDQGEREVAGSTWIRIEDGGETGWINSRYVTEAIPSDVFCADSAAMATLDAFIAATDQRDARALVAESVSTNRGLRVRHDWWNNEVILGGQTLSALFSDEESRDWGTAMGSGEPLSGSFPDVILPMLEEDLVGGVEVACNEILQGGTAGLVQLPPDYEGINYFSVHRPGTDELGGLDWGTWVVGIERWNGEYFVSFLVHFAWEI